MTARNETLDFLLTRRSRPAKLLGGPGPDREGVETLLTAGARVPDHGKLEPWRFIVLRGAGLARFVAAIRTRAAETGDDPDKGALPFEQAPLAVAVVGFTRPNEKIPPIEQTLSAGAVCLGVLNAALASGWGANWLTGWPAYDRTLLADELDLDAHEWIAGFIHVGTAKAAPPDRPRPDIASITTWIDA